VSDTTRSEKLIADLQALQGLQDASTILRLEPTGNPPDRYLVTFHGKGLRRDVSTGAVVEQLQHQCELRLGSSYPRYAPDIRWLTPLFHPNISFGGFIRTDDVGIPWNADLTLDVVCERLWDVARLAYYDLDNAANYAAGRWLQESREVALPADPRPLRDKTAAVNKNIVRYRRRGEQQIDFGPGEQQQDTLYIGEQPSLPATPGGSQSGDGDDVLYIGEND
jgi:ubiquitin-protein ligase